MHKLAKKMALLLVALTAFAVALPLVPARASLGNILIDTKTGPSVSPTIKLGESVNLYFGGVTWSGGQVKLYISTDPFAALNTTTDIPYGPAFSVAKITANATDTTTYSGYSVGHNWINGTIPKSLEIPGGKYYIKAFDGVTGAVAVTDNYINIIASFEVTPTFGPGQAPITLKGYALPANGYANFSYNAGAGWKVIKDLVKANEKGRIVYSISAPDLEKVVTPQGEQNESLQMTTIYFRMIVNSTGQTETDTFVEYYRGLVQVKGENSMTATTGFLYGNETTSTASVLKAVKVKVMGSLIIVGKWFHPGALTILWDKAQTIGGTEANTTHGWFNTTVTVPITSKGLHNVTIDDGKVKFVFWVTVIPTLILTPDEGTVGTTVTAKGYGFPASTSTVVYNVTLTWDYTDICKNVSVDVAWALTTTQGHFTTSFVVPHTVGGTHIVTATANDSVSTTAPDTFKVLVALIVTPSSATNNGTVVTVKGTGLAYDEYYDLLINGKDFYSADSYGWTVYFNGSCTGDLSLQIIVDASFAPGKYAVSLYKLSKVYQLPTLEKYVMFTVTGEEETKILDKLDEIDAAVADLDSFVRSDSTSVHNELTTVKNGITTVKNSINDAKQAVLTAVGGVSNQLTSIESYAKDAASKAASAATSAGDAASKAASAATAAQAAQSATSGISTAVYGAIVLSLIAALASIVAVITLQRKVA